MHKNAYRLALAGVVLNDSPSNLVQVRKDLTDYAFGLTQDVSKVIAVANLFAPVVPTGATSGRFNKFNDQQDFKNYAEQARRAIGTQANRIGFLSTTDTYSAEPYGLQITVDEFERKQAAGGGQPAITLLEQAKTRTLTINCAVAHASAVLSAVNGNVSATAGLGDWKNAAKDPVQEIDDSIMAVWRATGVVPNVIAFDFGAWAVFKNHPKVVARLVGAEVAVLTPQRAQTLFVNPNIRIEIVDIAVLSGGGLGNSSATKVGLLGGNVYVFSTSATATQYDPSFMKTFAPSANLFTGIRQWEEGANLTVLQNDWTAGVELISNLLCKRIAVNGANG